MCHTPHVWEPLGLPQAPEEVLAPYSGRKLRFKESSLALGGNTLSPSLVSSPPWDRPASSHLPLPTWKMTRQVDSLT